MQSLPTAQLAAASPFSIGPRRVFRIWQVTPMSLSRCRLSARLGHPRPTAPLLRPRLPKSTTTTTSDGAPLSAWHHRHHNSGQTRPSSYLSSHQASFSGLRRYTSFPKIRLASTPLLPTLISPSPTPYPARQLATMSGKLDPALVKQHHADSPPTVVRLEIESHFEPLDDKQKRYAHYISK